MIRLLRDAHAAGALDEQGHPVYVVTLPPLAVHGVVFGLRTPLQDRKRIRAAVADSTFSHLRIYQVEFDMSASALRVVPLDA